MAKTDNTPAINNDLDKANSGLIKRLIASLYDTLLAAAILLAVTALNMGVFMILDSAEHIKSDPFVSLGPLHVPSLWLSMYIFYVYFWNKNGQTLGMQAWRIKVICAKTGLAPSWKQASLRFLAAHLSLLSGGIGLLWLLVDKQNRSWHDLIANTRVIVCPKD
jgi:uncharacterized RDD family membrane protein YckC